MPITDAEKRQMKAKEDARQKHFLRNQGKMKQRR